MICVILVIPTVPEVQRNRKSKSQYKYKFLQQKKQTSKKLKLLQNRSSSSSTMFSRFFQKSSPQQSSTVRAQFFTAECYTRSKFQFLRIFLVIMNVYYRRNVTECDFDSKV